MKILVCVKHSFPTDRSVIIDPSGQWVLDCADGATPQLGRYDELAVEQALTIKDQNPGATVDAITAGSLNKSAILRRAMGMGADSGIHVLTSADVFTSAVRTASLIVSVVRLRSYDLILTGAMSDDLSQGLVGPMLAGKLDIPYITSCVRLNVDSKRSVVVAERDIEGGRRQIVELDLPALASIQACDNKPRYPSLSNIIRAQNQIIETIQAACIDESESGETLLGLTYTPKSGSVNFLTGTCGDKAKELASILRKRAFLR